VNSKDQMREYFTTLFPDLGAGEQIHIRCLDTSGTAVAHDFFSTIDRAILFCLKHSGKNHVYPAVNPRDKAKVKEEKASGRSRGGGKNTVSRVVTLWADYDLEKFGKTKEEGLEYLQNLSGPPTMVLFTGAGFQPFWILEEAARSAEDMARSERIINAFTLWWGIDKGVKDYSRVLRAPGTENIKYDPPRMCHIEQSDNGARYSLDELEAMIPEEYRSPQYSSSSRSHSSKGAGGEHRNGGDPLATPEVPLGPNSNRHPRGTSVVGHYASLRTSSGHPVSEEWVKRQAELWMESPNNCSAPLHLSESPDEIKEWERLVSDICKKEKMKTKASENGLGPLTHSPPMSTMGV
jgi:RepB DNA-primase from phage plasmid